jgi:acyl-CoA synthetase (AMP-forming)/AMP-acid ligase II
MTFGQQMNIGMNFARVANANPNHEAIVAADITLTYGKLWRIAQGFATRMRELGIDRSSTVAVHSRDMIACVASMLASSLLGARYVFLEPRLVDDCVVMPTHILRSPDVKPFKDLTYHMMDASWPQAGSPDSDGSEFPGYGNADDPWWIVHTSGTTGKPKYLNISQRAVYDRSMAVQADFKPLHTRLCSLFPCNTRPFVARANAALLNACTIIDTIDIAFMQAQGVNLVCGAPRTAMQWLAGRTVAPRMPVIQVSGAKLSDTDAAVLLQSFDTVEDVYGSSETSKSFVNVKTLNQGQVVTRGQHLDSEVQIIGMDGAPCTGPGLEGTVRIRNGYMASAYIAAPQATEKAFRDGWFYPGDLGWWGPAGALVIGARLDEVINLGGEKVDPNAVDEVLCSVLGITGAASFRDPNNDITPPRLMAMVTVSDLAEADTCVAAAHLACRERLAAIMVPQMIFVVTSIPMTSDGAPRRIECQLLAQELIKKVNRG